MKSDTWLPLSLSLLSSFLPFSSLFSEASKSGHATNSIKIPLPSAAARRSGAVQEERASHWEFGASDSRREKGGGQKQELINRVLDCSHLNTVKEQGTAEAEQGVGWDVMGPTD